MKTALDFNSIARIMGRLILIESLMLLVPMAVSLVYRESDWKGFAVAATAAFAVGGAAKLSTRRTETPIRRREGFFITALISIVR